MSFSSDVKEELAKQLNKSRHCQIAELAAIFAFAGKIIPDEKGVKLEITTENVLLARKCFTLMKKAFNISTDISMHSGSGVNRIHVYTISMDREEDVRKVLQALHIMDLDGRITLQESLTDGIVVQKECCKRSFIRGAYLSAGSMSDPEKSYHFEIVCSSEPKAEQLKEMMNHFGMDAKVVLRKKYYVVYLKEGEQIVDMLNIMEAYKSLMNLENVRILKEMRNSVNRQVNCETANINKTVNAAVKQLDDIKLIEEHMGLEKLPPGLKEMAEIRMEFPEAALKELGTYFDPPIGKSGVNHRLRKLGEIADSIRK